MEELVYYYPEGHEAHSEPGHPESPERVEAVRTALDQAGWWFSYKKLAPAAISEDLLHSVHAPEYLSRLKQACEGARRLDPDTYTTNATWNLAMNAVGGSIAVAKSVWNGDSRRGFALTRPPGHHAGPSRGMGFCLLNNISLAAQALIQSSDPSKPAAKRLAIIDLDLHHGNGTQDIFWKRPDVFYISIHQSPFFPGTGRLDECGVGQGEWTNANFPLPPGSGDSAFLTIMHRLILPLLDRFAPEMLLVSFGSDPHWRDPLGSLCLSAQACHELIQLLAAWADRCCAGKIALFLEGGYDLLAGKACSQAAVSALLGESWMDTLGSSPQPETSDWKENYFRALRIWKFDDAEPELSILEG